MNLARTFRNKGTQFSVAFREGSDEISDKPGAVEFLAEIAGTLLCFLNALMGWAWLPFRRRTSHPAIADVKLDFGIEAVRPYGANRNHILCGFYWTRAFITVTCRSLFATCSVFSVRISSAEAEDITPADFVDLAAVREEIWRCGKKIGFWIYIRRDGRYVLVRYSIRVRADRMADLYLEPLPMAS